jgi:putative phage-type endonuclease
MDPRVAKLVMKKKIEQRSPEWYEIRGNLITASSASNLLVRDDTCDPYILEYNLQDVFLKDKKCCNPYSSKNQYILDKALTPKFKGSVATYHGQKYEDVVCDIYRNKFNTEIIDFGIIQHEEYSWLGASPDGITPDGIMIEIKCPYRRKITGIPPLYYWIQVQLQLEVCDLDACDFVEYEFAEFETEEEFIDDTTLQTNVFHKGAVVSVHKLDGDDNIILGESQYAYPPKEILDHTEEVVKWAKNKKEQLERLYAEQEFSSKLKIEYNYWKVVDYSILRIYRDKKWFESVKPVFEKSWNEICYYKKGDNYKHLITSQKSLDELNGGVLHLNLENHCMLTDDDDSSMD